jgi:membrane-associated protease RseP (regulator of RpoE activity)
MPITPTETETLTPIVARVLKIDAITTGSADQGYLVSYHGRLYGDSQAAYDQLEAALRPFNITPLFRMEEDMHVVVLVEGTVRPEPSNPVVNLVMFIITLLSVLFTGAALGYEGPAPESLTGFFSAILGNLSGGIPFAASLLAILLAHEFGHYLAGRFHGVHVTLPYFLPLPYPISPFGTMGAFIRLKEIPKNKRILLDIGIAGPLAGLVVAIPVLLYGLSLSNVEPLHQVPGQMMEGNSILYLASKYAVFGELLPAPPNETIEETQPALYWLRYFFTGEPFPEGGRDVLIHPVAWAGWAGLLVTALNLIPAGQLDGGHMIYVLLGRRTRKLAPFVLGALLLLAFFWSGWLLWAFLIFLLGRVYAEPLDQITPLDTSRKALALLGIIVFILVFTPVPLKLY